MPRWDVWDGTAYGDVFDGIDEGLALVEPEDGRIAAVNRAIVELTETNRESLVGRELSTVTNNDCRASVAYAMAMVERAAAGEPQTFEWQDQNASGDHLDLEVRFSPTTIDDDEYVLVVVRDVSAERALRRRKERLEEFAGVVSHDLRGPLNVIQGELGRFHETGDREHLEAVEAASIHLDSVVTDLLDLARDGQTIREPEVVSLELVARRAWSLVDSRGATLSVTTDLELEADSKRLTRALENLFRNSVEHGSTSSRAEPDDSVEHGSTGSRTQSGDSVEHGSTTDPIDPPEICVGELREEQGFFVADDGTGIPSATRERVFEPGFSTDEDGTGLGLPIVHRICEAHGWSIDVEESEWGGARFVVRGPMRKQSVEP